MSGNLKILADNRDALLLAEIAAWLHMFGKLHEEFLNGKNYLASEIPEAVQDNFLQLDALLKDPWFGSIWKQLPLGGSGTEKLTFAQLIRTHQEEMEKYTEGFRRLLIDAHGRGSGTEKGLLDRFAYPLKNPVYFATSLGYEEPIDATNIQRARMKLYSFLEKKLGELKAKNADLGLAGWELFRGKFIDTIREFFCITVAETRRPLNDITLLDQTAISVAFFKAALAQNLLLGKWKDPSQQKVKDKYHWRLLRIGLDGLAFWGNAIRIGDLLARKEYIDGALNNVQALLEVVYPLGFEIYRDENGSIFIVPDIDHLLTYTDGSQPLEELIQTIADDTLSSETRFTLSLSSSTRDALLFGKLATKSLPWPTAQLTWLKQQWIGQERDICPVCGLRPQGPGEKALSRKVCDICEERRSNRSEEWIKNPSTTIWIDEVADVHGQLALLIANFDIADWLSGSAFNTVLAFDPKSGMLSDKKQKPPKPQNYNFDLHALIRNIQDGLQPDQKFEDNLLGYLVLDDQRGGSDIVQDFYDLHVTHTDLKAISSAPKPELLALSMIRQSPSFARIYRTWETTKKFWKDIESTFENTVGKVGTRLRIQGNFIPNPGKPSTLGVSHTYELKLDNVNLSVVCTKEGELVTVDNLYRTAILLGASKESREDYSLENYNVMARYVGDSLRQRESFDLEEPTGYGGPNNPIGRLLITSVNLEDKISYLPAVTILTEPRTFMALAPASTALEIAQAIKEKFEKEVGKVRNRLPLTLGIVFAGSRTPLPAILDAGRRTLKQPTESESWTIKRVATTSSTVILTLEKDGQSLTLEIPVVMDDTATLDAWYPYWSVEKDKHDAKPSGRTRQFTAIDDKEWVHVCDLQEGDVVQFMPSRFDFEFLDTAARRFEVSYNNGKRRGSYHPSRPYYFEQLDDFETLWKLLSSSLATSQIHNLISIIETKRMEWLAKGDDLTFQNIVRHALNNAYWNTRPSQEDFQRLEQAALSGQLADVVELYIRILKYEPQADKIGGGNS